MALVQIPFEAIFATVEEVIIPALPALSIGKKFEEGGVRVSEEFKDYFFGKIERSTEELKVRFLNDRLGSCSLCPDFLAFLVVEGAASELTLGQLWWLAAQREFPTVAFVRDKRGVMRKVTAKPWPSSDAFQARTIRGVGEDRRTHEDCIMGQLAVPCT